MMRNIFSFMGFALLSQFAFAQNGLRIAEVEYTIPVVVHVVYKNAEQNISDERIYSQINALNRDFQKLNADTIKIDPAFIALAGKSKIQFRLAEIDPDGNFTTGITRTATIHSVFGNNEIFSNTTGGKDPWDETRYLNIWVCDLLQGLLGRSSSPEGVVIDYQYFGEYSHNGFISLGRTALHEIGHWAGLKHLHATGNCSEDGIADTPVQLSGMYNCNLNSESCGSKDMTQNFMQSNHDTCLLFFTPGQVEFMETELVNNRKVLLEQGAALGITASQDGFEVYPTFLNQNDLFIKSPFPSRNVIMEVIQPGFIQTKKYQLDLKSGINEVPVTNFYTGLNIIRISTFDQMYLFKIYVQDN